MHSTLFSLTRPRKSYIKCMESLYRIIQSLFTLWLFVCSSRALNQQEGPLDPEVLRRSLWLLLFLIRKHFLHCYLRSHPD